MAGRIDHLKSAAHQSKLLGLPPPEEFEKLKESEEKMSGFLWMIFNLWADCQRWDGAGKIRIETLRELCSDHGFAFDSFTRSAIAEIENCYRKVQSEQMRR